MKNMTFEEFKIYIQEHIGEYLSDDFKDAQIRVSTIKKSNGYEYEGMNISRANDLDGGIIPVVNLTDAYAKYEKGAPLVGVMQDLAKVRMNSPIPDGISRSTFTNFDSMRDRIFPRLISAKNQEDYLSNRPFHQVADLAVVYTVRVHTDEHGFAEAVVDNELLKIWGVDESTLHEAALANLEKQEPVFMNLEDAMFGSLDAKETPKFEPETIDMDRVSIPFFLLTNQQKVKGATMALSSRVMDRIAEKFGGIYVLPSSTHEVLIVPKSFMDDPDQLAEMVRQVNEDAVLPEDRLSDNVYEYNPETQSLEIASTDPVQGEGMNMG